MLVPDKYSTFTKFCGFFLQIVVFILSHSIIKNSFEIRNSKFTVFYAPSSSAYSPDTTRQISACHLQF